MHISVVNLSLNFDAVFSYIDFCAHAQRLQCSQQESPVLQSYCVTILVFI